MLAITLAAVIGTAVVLRRPKLSAALSAGLLVAGPKRGAHRAIEGQLAERQLAASGMTFSFQMRSWRNWSPPTACC